MLQALEESLSKNKGKVFTNLSFIQFKYIIYLSTLLKKTIYEKTIDFETTYPSIVKKLGAAVDIASIKSTEEYNSMAGLLNQEVEKINENYITFRKEFECNI